MQKVWNIIETCLKLSEMQCCDQEFLLQRGRPQMESRQEEKEPEGKLVTA